MKSFISHLKSKHIGFFFFILLGSCLSTSIANAEYPFQQDNDESGIVSMEAESFDENTPRGSHAWNTIISPSGFSGTAAMRAEPDIGTNNNTGYVSNSPRMDFKVNFVKTGTHYIWIRGYRTGYSDDSCHAGLDGQAIDTADRISNFSSYQWSWTGTSMESDRVTIDVEFIGIHTVNIWMREDGFRIDKIVLTTNPGYTPTGNGPDESPRFVQESYLKGDLSQDHRVNFEDLVILREQWLSNEIPADIWPVDGDGIVDFFDWAVFANQWKVTVDFEALADFAEQWLKTGIQYCIADIAPDDGDRTVNLLDFALLAENWFEGCHKPALVINEFMASNSSCIADEQNEFEDWIEIYNPTAVAIDIGGMYITDDLNNPTKWRIPDDCPGETTIQPYQYLILWADEDIDDGPLHLGFKLSKDAEDIGLYWSDGSMIDSISFENQVSDISYGRYPDAADNWRYMGNPTPGMQNSAGYLGLVDEVDISHLRGFYDSAFEVELTCDTNEAVIYYTLNGSEPNETTGTEYDPDIRVQITGTACLRAAAFRPGYKSSRVNTCTYIFVDDVITQSPGGEAPGPAWPPPNTGYGQWIDYGMDPDVVSDSRYIALLDDALLALPAISVVTDLKNLFDPATGIYMNPRQEGIEWERPTSVELIYPDGNEGFQINAGLRIRGGWSRHEDNPKHAFRLFFRSEYGQAKLKYPLFGTEGVNEFDSMDLRTSMNYSWSYYGDSKNTMVRDVFSRDLQRDMGRPYTRSRYYHLYINDHYWGLFQTQERPEASYAASYFGGENEDYDVIKVNGWPGADYEIMATDGNLAAYEDLWQAATAGFSADVAYYGVQGLKLDGSCDPNGIRLVDIDNLIDYMLGIYFTGDKDSPISSFKDDRRPNNLWAVYNRNNPDGFKYLRHDSEHSLDTGYVDRTGPYDNSYLRQFIYFTPQWLSQKLTVNAKYVKRFADRVHKYFFNGGALTPSSAAARWTARVNEIDLAIIAESARWGDVKTHPPRTKDDDWLPAVNYLTSSYFPSRTAVVLNQFKSKGWYPSVSAPSFSQHGGEIAAGAPVAITGGGTIYYTTDGSEPADYGTFISGGSSVIINHSLTLKARADYGGGSWSALNEATFAVGPVIDDLRITEIMYHPYEADDTDPNDPNQEFIELKNIGSSPLNLNLVSFSEGIHFTFPNMSLAPGDYVLVVKNQPAFESRYGGGKNIAGQWIGILSNGGERIRLQDAIGRTIIDFSYEDGWRRVTDGGGFSLTIFDASDSDLNRWSDKANWCASEYPGGTPDENDPGLLKEHSIVINEVLAHTDTYPNDWIELFNTTDSPIDIGGWFLSDSDEDDAELMKYEIAAGTVLGAGDYLVLTQDTNFGQLSTDPGKNQPFALSEYGETVYLTSSHAGQLTGYREQEDFDDSENGVAFGRHQKSTGTHNFVAMSSNTPGAENAYPQIGPVVINEIMYNPASRGQNEEYVELYNITGDTVNLYDANNVPWKFTDGIKFSFPPGTSIPGHGFMLVVNTTPAYFLTKYPSVPGGVQIFGSFKGQLSNDGEKLQLNKTGDVDEFDTQHYIRVDRVSYSDGSHPENCSTIDPWPVEADGGGNSLTRLHPALYGNDPNNWQAAAPTPGS